MLAFIQISKTNTTKDAKYYWNAHFRRCFPSIKASRLNPTAMKRNFKPGHIVGAVLFPGRIDQETYTSIADPANTSYMKLYKAQKNKQTIYVYPSIAIVPFKTSFPGTQRGNIAPLFIKDHNLAKQCNQAVGSTVMKALKTLLKQYQITSNTKVIEKRMLVLRLEHAINLMCGIKSAEFRTQRIADKFLKKITTKRDLKILSKYKKRPHARNVRKLLKYCNQYNLY